MPTKLFALDIGTRSVVGIILEETNDTYHVADIIVKEHKERAMVDGQIHNVVYVAELIAQIRKELELKHGPLTKVSVAAAGRSLKTERATITVNIKNRAIFTEEDINRLELQAVQQAQQQLVQQRDDIASSHYYCVGYSVLHYRLDNETIGSLLDQQGNEAAIEVIATFLPRVVVESLIAALKRADLEMDALTLEPIAAINVLIPQTMRRLNVALVDIGAGTSDIAITDQNTVVAYGMVPTAGDEVTEALSDTYLLDFPVAERIKRTLSTNEPIIMQDILGFDQTYEHAEVLHAILPTVRQLAAAIGNEILLLNSNTPPKAVMLVGGGSLTPQLPELLGEVLQLPANRIAVRGIDAIQNITRDDSIAPTPELVTPIGIAIAAKKMPIQYMSLKVNGQIVRLFEVKEMTVGDAMLAANIRAKQLFGKPGQALAITVNGQDIFIPGEHGQPATLLLNGEPASTKTRISSNDEITIIDGKDGKVAVACVKDILDGAMTKNIMIEDKAYTLEPKISINGQPATLQSRLKDRDVITYTIAETIEDALTLANERQLIENCRSFSIFVDNRAMHLPAFSAELRLNGQPAKLTYPIKNGDRIHLRMGDTPTAQMIADEVGVRLTEAITVTFQDQAVTLTKTENEIQMNGLAIAPNQKVTNGARIAFIPRETSPFIFQDVFRFSDWQLPTVASSFTILRNDMEVGFDSLIFGGDTLKIIFD